MKKVQGRRILRKRGKGVYAFLFVGIAQEGPALSGGKGKLYK